MSFFHWWMLDDFDSIHLSACNSGLTVTSVINQFYFVKHNCDPWGTVITGQFPEMNLIIDEWIKVDLRQLQGTIGLTKVLFPRQTCRLESMRESHLPRLCYLPASAVFNCFQCLLLPWLTSAFRWSHRSCGEFLALRSKFRLGVE